MATQEEEDLATAMLLGGDFVEGGNGRWYVAPLSSPYHPIEEANNSVEGDSSRGFKTRNEIVQAYLAYALKEIADDQS